MRKPNTDDQLQFRKDWVGSRSLSQNKQGQDRRTFWNKTETKH